MPKIRLRLAIGLVSAGVLAALAGVSASTGAMAAVTAPAHAASAHPSMPRVIGAYHRVGAIADQATTSSELQNVANSDCLNGTLALVYLTTCNSSDNHMIWIATEYTANSNVAYTLENAENGECLNGYTGTAHAEVTLTPCSSSDTHMLWFPNTTYTLGEEAEFQNISNSECLNGYTGSAHAEVTLTPCADDTHMFWWSTIPS